MFLEHQTQDGREEVWDADDEGAVVGVDDRVGLLKDESRVEGDCTLWKIVNNKMIYLFAKGVIIFLQKSLIPP